MVVDDVTKIVLKFGLRYVMISTMEAFFKVAVHNSDVAQCNNPIKTASGQWPDCDLRGFLRHNTA